MILNCLGVLVSDKQTLVVVESLLRLKSRSESENGTFPFIVRFYFLLCFFSFSFLKASLRNTTKISTTCSESKLTLFKLKENHADMAIVTENYEGLFETYKKRNETYNTLKKGITISNRHQWIFYSICRKIP